MPDAEPSPHLTPRAAGLAAVATVVVLWGARDTLTRDVLLRLCLPGLWLVAWSLACLGAGYPVVARLLASRRGTRVPAVVVLASGAAILALAAATLALVGGFRSGVLAAILATTAVAGGWVLWRRHTLIRWLPDGLASPVTVLVVAPAAVTLVLVSTPPVMYDVLHYHLAFPAQWLLHGGFVEFARESFSYYSSAHGALYAFALSTVGPWGANALDWWMAALATLAAATLAERLAGSRATAWAAACFVCTPVTLEIAGYAVADLAVAAWAGAALLVLVGGDEPAPDPPRICLAGFLAASAAAAKYLALATVLAPLTLAAVAYCWRPAAGRSRRGRAALAIAFTVAVAIPLAPWLGRNLAWTGNPVYPYLTTIFGGPPTKLDLATDLARNVDLPHDTLGRLAASVGALVLRTFSPRLEGGILGPQWLILLPVAAALAGLRPRLRLCLWIATLAGLLAWGCLVQYGRFLLPVLVPAAALAGAAAAALSRGLGRASRIAFTTALVAVLAWNATVVASAFNLDRLAVVTGWMDEGSYRSKWFDAAPAVDFVAAELPSDACVLLVAESRSFGIQRPVLVEDPYRVPLLVELARRSPSPAALAASVRALGATHILVNQREMARFARIRGVPDYLAGATPAQRDVIAAFLDHQVVRLFSSDGLWVGRIVDQDRSVSPQAAPAAFRVPRTDRGETASSG